MTARLVWAYLNAGPGFRHTILFFELKVGVWVTGKLWMKL
jgi:hypothetical protein